MAARYLLGIVLISHTITANNIQTTCLTENSFHFEIETTTRCPFSIELIQQIQRSQCVWYKPDIRWMVNNAQSFQQCPVKRSFQLFDQSIVHWSPANVQLIDAVLKVAILVLFKIILKYYVRGYLKSYIDSEVLFELLDLTSKALTIAIAKFAIKWAVYAALRTAAKSLLISSMRSIAKPVTKFLRKRDKNNLNNIYQTILIFAVKFQLKVIIKTIAILLLSFVFANEQMSITLAQLMFRISLILGVKTGAKRFCKILKAKSKKKECTDSAPVDRVLLFALQKLVTKLIKIPLIKILL